MHCGVAPPTPYGLLHREDVPSSPGVPPLLPSPTVIKGSELFTKGQRPYTNILVNLTFSQECWPEEEDMEEHPKEVPSRYEGNKLNGNDGEGMNKGD